MCLIIIISLFRLIDVKMNIDKWKGFLNWNTIKR